MLTLNPIFSDHALFQCSSVLTLRGHSSPGSSLKAEIVRMGIVSCTAAGTAAQDGTFALAINTPDGSFDAYEITVTDGTNTVTCTDVLFGELWLASGQSNMELTCEFQPECDSMLEQLRGSGVRVYSVAYAKPNTDGLQFSRTPEDDTPGEWFTDDTVEKWKHVSACATSFVLNIARYYKKTGKSVPIGFLNASWGGTPIFSWLPLDVIDADERCCAYLTDAGFYPIDEKWNTFKNNANQPGVMYNRKIGPLLGVRVRGIIWYQGENEVRIEPTWRIYAHAQRLYYQHYAKMFAADERAFVVLSSLIFPWAYGESGECMRSYLNRALIENAKLYPERFIVCPNDDLPPVWAPNLNNEPIHPVHKFRLGARMAQLALANVYGAPGQKAAATLKSYEVQGDRIILTFENVGSGLYIKGNRIDGMFVAGEDGHYVPAECEILSADTLAVRYESLDHPRHAAYSVSSFAFGANLWAGEYPAAPFATDHDSPGCLCMEAMPFLNPDIDSVWEVHHDRSVTSMDVYSYPVWHALPGSEVCRDPVFADVLRGYTHSIRIAGTTAPIGAYVRSSCYYQLLLNKFSSLELDLYHRGTLEGYIEIEHEAVDGVSTTVRRALVACEGASYTFRRYRADLTALPDCTVSQLRFVFNVKDDQPLCSVNIGRIALKL